jgi:hypothetical protein
MADAQTVKKQGKERRGRPAEGVPGDCESRRPDSVRVDAREDQIEVTPSEGLGIHGALKAAMEIES